MKKVLLAMLAVSMMTSVGTAGHLKNMSDESSAASESAVKSIGGSLEFSGDKLTDLGNWLGKQSGDLSTFVSDVTVSAIKVSQEVGTASLTASLDLGSLVLDVVIASGNVSAQALTNAYNEGRKVNVTIINPKAIEAAAKGNFASKSAAASGELSNKASETVASVVVSVLVSSGEIVISPATYVDELTSVRQVRAAKAARK